VREGKGQRDRHELWSHIQLQNGEEDAKRKVDLPPADNPLAATPGDITMKGAKVKCHATGRFEKEREGGKGVGKD